MTPVLDEIGYLPMEPDEASLFFCLVTRWYEKGSVILTSSKSFIDWGEVFGDQAIATQYWTGYYIILPL